MEKAATSNGACAVEGAWRTPSRLLCRGSYGSAFRPGQRRRGESLAGAQARAPVDESGPGRAFVRSRVQAPAKSVMPDRARGPHLGG